MKKNALIFVLLASTSMNVFPKGSNLTPILHGVAAENFDTSIQAVCGVALTTFGCHVLNKCRIHSEKETDNKIEPATVLLGSGCAVLGVALCVKAIHNLIA
jgi:hypothetical protein